MLLNHQQRKILELLCKTEHVTASELAGQLGIGVKTVRVRIKELNPELEKKGIQILSKSRYGYYLDPRQPEGIEGLLNPKENEDPVIPSNNQERVHFLLAYLLNRTEYIKSEELCDFLYISKGTLTNTLRQVEETYQKYGITVHKKPGYGIRVEGSEFNLRQCMVDVFVKQDSLEGIGRRHQTDEIETLGKMVYQCLKKYEIELSEIAYNDFVEHIYVAMRRIRQEKYVEPQAADMLGRKEKQFVEELTELVGTHYQIHFSQDEKNYLTLQLVGKVYIDSETEQENFVMQSEIDRLITEMLEMIYREFHVDFRNDFHLRMELNRHMVPFVLRMKYHMILRNPMLEEIRKNYVLSYTMASQAAIALGEYFQQSISEDEIAGLAEVLELALEQQKNEQKKFSILIVCASGKTSSEILRYKYSREFKEYIEKIYVCNLYELENFPFEKVDYVFTTVHISSYVPVPILEIGSFLQDNDIDRVRKLFVRESKDFLQKYFKKELFFTDVEGKTKDEVLKNLCRKVEQEKGLPETFTASVLKREELTPTDYGNLVALPHPERAFQECAFVAVAVLKEPIFWFRQKVQVVFLTAIGREEDENLQQFYEATTDLILRPADMQNLIRHPDYDRLIQLLRRAEE